MPEPAHIFSPPHFRGGVAPQVTGWLSVDVSGALGNHPTPSGHPSSKMRRGENN